MGFDYNPLEHIEVVRELNGSYTLHCHNCGADFPRKPLLSGETAIKVFFDAMAVHVDRSHNAGPDTFVGRSKY